MMKNKIVLLLMIPLCGYGMETKSLRNGLEEIKRGFNASGVNTDFVTRRVKGGDVSVKKGSPEDRLIIGSKILFGGLAVGVMLLCVAAKLYEWHEARPSRK